MENLLFFNQKGYPYNFTYNSNEIWEGKIIFDENASDTFKTVGMYIFETVNPISFTTTANFLQLNYYDNSGLTFTSQSNYSNESITNIFKVNTSSQFYSKWIKGDKFDIKFPKGTFIRFSNVTGDTSYSSDFDNSKYFQVVDNKKNHIMIITDTNNNTFNFNFSAGTISNTLNVISINDYNRNLLSDVFFQNLYSDKKLSILNSIYNDGIKNVNESGITLSYINEIELTGNTLDIFKLRLYFLTERPKLYRGRVVLSKNNLGQEYITLRKVDSNFSIGTDFTFENEVGEIKFSGYSFTVTGFEDKEDLASKTISFIRETSAVFVPGKITGRKSVANYKIEYNGNLGLDTNDIIYLSATTLTTSHLHHNRQFKILDKTFSNGKTILDVKDYVIPETGNTYLIKKVIQPHQRRKLFVNASGFLPYGFVHSESDVIAYSTNNYLDLTQTILSGTTTGTSVNSIFYNTIESFLSKYKNSLSNNYGLISYYVDRNDKSYLCIESKYGTYKPYIYVSGFTNNIKLPDDFSLSSSGLTNRYNIIVDDKLTKEVSYRNDYDILSRLSYASILMNLNYNTSNYGFKLTVNGNEYFASFTGDTITTINYFINNNEDLLYSNGFNVYSGYTTSGYTLNVSGINPDINIWGIEMNVNLFSTYQILEHEQNQGIIISGNEIQSTSIDFFNIGLSTGMILQVSGSSYNINNKEYNIIGLTQNTIQLSYQGEFISETGVTLLGNTKEFLRKPRGAYNKDIYFKLSWIPIEDRENPIDPNIFFYDISGTQLKPYKNIDKLAYTGPLPLISAVTNNVVYLNTVPNNRLDRINIPKYQQTVFDELEFKLEQLDSSQDYNWIPIPLEVFIGYNSKYEGVNYNLFKIEKIEKMENSDLYFHMSGTTTAGFLQTNNFYFSMSSVTFDSPFVNFINYGFEPGQQIIFKFKDTASSNQILFDNVYPFEISNISRNRIFFTTTAQTFSTTGSSFLYDIEVQPKEIARFSIYGQTEIEDVRFKINLNNLGVNIGDDVAKIFKESDIKDNTVNYSLLNKKRKEMLTNFREIYDYIGSYKGLVNAINYFGYNDLELYEYYKNIDVKSILYNKLAKIRIPDIFDNTVEGWNEIDFIAGKYQDQSKWKKTNLFNLTYRITDEDGNNVQMYTLEEVQYKLGKLKNWLRKNVIPISANLLDITGVSDTPHTLYQDYDESNQVKGSVVSREGTMVNFNYITTLNFGTDYLVTVNFYILSGNTGYGPHNLELPEGTPTSTFSELPNSFTAKIKTFYLSGTTMVPVQYHKLNKTDLTSYSFNIDKTIDPYIYIETTTYSNDGSGLGIKNNKMFYFDEPRNYWLVNHNFDMTQYKYILSPDYITNERTEIRNIIYNSVPIAIEDATRVSVQINVPHSAD